MPFSDEWYVKEASVYTHIINSLTDSNANGDRYYEESSELIFTQNVNKSAQK